MCLLIGEKAIVSGVLFRAVKEYCCSLFAFRSLKISFGVKQIQVSDLCLTGCGSGTSLLFLYTHQGCGSSFMGCGGCLLPCLTVNKHPVK